MYCDRVLMLANYAAMKRNPSETKQLAEVVAIIAAAVTDIVEKRLRLFDAASERRISAHTTPASRTTERWATRLELAKHFNVSLRTVDRWISHQRVPYIKVGRKNVRFQVTNVELALSRSSSLEPLEHADQISKYA